MITRKRMCAGKNPLSSRDFKGVVHLTWFHLHRMVRLQLKSKETQAELAHRMLEVYA